MADSAARSSAYDMTDIFFDGVVCRHPLYVASSKIPDAGSGVFARETVPAGAEVLRAQPVVSAV